MKRPRMDIRQIQFILCTLFLHLIVLWWHWQHVPFGIGLAHHAGNQESGPSVLSIRFVQQQYGQPDPAKTSQSPGIERPLPEQIVSAPAAAGAAPEPIEQAVNQNAGDQHDYIPAGRLTRLPAPLEEINLDLPGITDVAVYGTLEMTLLIDASGMVADILALADNDDLRLFSERIGERFKAARFTPGEVNGRPVKSQLTITVVSEDLTRPAHEGSAPPRPAP